MKENSEKPPLISRTLLKGLEMSKYTYQNRDDQEIVITVNCVLNVPLMLVSIIGNSLILLAVLKTPWLRRSTSLNLLCSLAVSDLLVGLLVQPLYIADELQTLVNAEDLLLHHLSGMLGFFLCGVSLNTMTVASLDRMLALLYHMRYANLVSESRIKYIIAFVWLGTLILTSALYFWNKFVFHLISAFCISICLVVCTISYIRIYFIARRHQAQIRIVHQAVRENSDIKFRKHITRTIKSAVNTFIFYIFLILCYVPQVVLLIVFGMMSVKYWRAEWTFASTVIHMNSSVNPILYCWRLRELRKAVINVAKHYFHMSKTYDLNE